MTVVLNTLEHVVVVAQTVLIAPFSCVRCDQILCAYTGVCSCHPAFFFLSPEPFLSLFWCDENSIFQFIIMQYLPNTSKISGKSNLTFVYLTVPWNPITLCTSYFSKLLFHQLSYCAILNASNLLRRIFIRYIIIICLNNNLADEIRYTSKSYL